MGGTSFSSTSYASAASALHSSGKNFARSASAAASGNYDNIADHLDPSKLKNGVRECCFAPGFDDALPIVVSIDGTGSMHEVPRDIQRELPSLIELVREQDLSDRPNVLFFMHDDEWAMPPSAVFQMSQFETGSDELLGALNEMIIPGYGGGNRGEAYHLSFYATARHTKLEAFERDGTKGFFFMICDEEPFYDDADPNTHGTTPAVALATFGDSLEAEVPMIESVRAVAERFHVVILRPGHTSHGSNRNITRRWQELLRTAGANPELVLEVPETKDLVPTMALTIGRLYGHEADDLIDVLRAKGVNTDGAAAATSALVPIGTANAVAKVTILEGALTTTPRGMVAKPRSRR